MSLSHTRAQYHAHYDDDNKNGSGRTNGSWKAFQAHHISQHTFRQSRKPRRPISPDKGFRYQINLYWMNEHPRATFGGEFRDHI
jgi:hypothetical protein